MKVLLLNPPFAEYEGLEGHGGKALPLNLAYLAAYLRQRRPDIAIEVLDCEGLGLNYEKIEEKLQVIKPDIVGITMPTPAYVQVLAVAKIVKKVLPDIKVIVGGPHPTVLPEQTIQEEPIDICVVGEGEETFYELIEAIEKNLPLNNVKGIVFKDKGQIQQTERRPLIQDLDAIPFPARDLFPLDIYFPPPTKRMSNKKAGNMISSRGCPYQCTYCIASVMWERRVRFRSVKNLVDELEECCRKYGMGEFNFHDELFTVNKERVKEICQEIKRRNLDIAWVCMIRVDFADEETLRYMKEAGCKKIMFGFESGSQMILDKMKKRVALEKAEEAVKTVKKVGIKTAGNFMFGNIGETEETIKQSIKLAKKLNCDTIAFFIASPYPGTEFYKTAMENGYFRPDFEWKDFTLVGNNKPPLDLPGLPAEKILQWQKRAYLEYYLRPRYILMKLFGLRSWTEIQNLFNGLKLLLNLEKSAK